MEHLTEETKEFAIEKIQATMKKIFDQQKVDEDRIKKTERQIQMLMKSLRRMDTIETNMMRLQE